MFDSEPEPSMSAKDFALRELRSNSELSLAEVSQRARLIGLFIPPYLYGAARRELGLLPKVEPVPTTIDAHEIDAELAAADDAIAGDSFDHEISMAETGFQSAAPRAHTHSEPGIAADSTLAQADIADPVIQPKSSGFQFAVDSLRIAPDLSYQDLKLRASMASLSLPPIVYGRAKALLGLVPTKPRTPKVRVSDAPRSLLQGEYVQPSLRQGFVDLPKQGQMSGAISESLRQIEQLVTSVRELEAENRHLRNALQAAYSMATAAIETAE
ncbi:MAG: hypothetical protein WCR59_08405 [Planctomycetota bacterium]